MSNDRSMNMSLQPRAEYSKDHGMVVMTPGGKFQTLKPGEFEKAIAAFLAANAGARKVNLGTVNVGLSTPVALAAGTRPVPLVVPDLLAGDDLMLFPTIVPPTGYLIGAASVIDAGKASVLVTMPLLALGASFSVPCRAVVLRTWA